MVAMVVIVDVMVVMVVMADIVAVPVGWW